MNVPVIETGSQAYYFLAVMSFVFGTVIGSFLNVVIWRTPRGMSLSFPGSHCPKCNHAIMPWENIPIVSWLCLRGRCSSCHLPISWRYPAGEAAVGILYLFLFLFISHAGMSLALLPVYFWLAGTLLALAVIDAEHHMIPDKVVFSGYAAGLVMLCLLPEVRAFWAADWQAEMKDGTMILLAVELLLPLILALLGSCSCFASRSMVLLGWGDVKLILMLLLFLGVRRSFDILLGGAVLGCLLGFVLMFCRSRKGRKKSFLKSEIAFGSCLAIVGILRLFGG